jgi:hypothetical protein
MKSFLIVDEGDRLVIKQLEEELIKLQQLLDKFIQAEKGSTVHGKLIQDTAKTNLSTRKGEEG